MNIKLQTNEQLSATVANGLAGVFVNGVSLSASLSSKADLTALQNCYTKSETSSSSEISNELKKYQLSGNYLSVNALVNYYTKSETSSANEISTALENAGGKVYFDNRISDVTGSNDLSVVKLSADEYAQMLDDGTCVSNAIYIVEAPNIDAFKQRITNVAPPTDLSDAATKEYVDNALTNIQVPADLSAFTNSPGYTTNTGTITGITMNGASKGTSGIVNLGTVLTAHQSLSNCLQNNSSYDSINLTANSQCTFNFPHINLPDTSILFGDFNNESLYASKHRVELKELDADGGYGSVQITTAPDIQIVRVAGIGPEPPKTPAELMSEIKFTGGTKNSPVTSSLADLIYTKNETSSASEISSALSSISSTLSAKLDASAAWPAWVAGELYDLNQVVSHNGKLWKANEPGPIHEPGSAAAIEWLSVDISSVLTSQYQPKGNYLTAVPTTYKTYSQTVAALSSNGYATSTQVNQKSTVSFNQITTTGTNIGSITIDGTTTQIYAPNSGGGGGSGSTVEVSADYQSGTKIATISVDSVPTSIYIPNSATGSTRYALATATLQTAGNSLSCAVDDQTITTIQVSSSSTPIIVQLPAEQQDGARDFILRIEISSSAAPTFTFNGVNETIDFDSEDDDWAVLEPGLNLISFTETKRGTNSGGSTSTYCMVTFDIENGKNASQANATFVNPSDATRQVEAGQPVGTLPTLSYSVLNYEFNGWYTTPLPADGQQVTDQTVITKDTTFYALFYRGG